MMVDMVIPEYEETPPPIVRTQQSAESVAAARWDWECQRLCATQLVLDVSAHIGGRVPADEMWVAMQRLPAELLDMLYTADGWAKLSEYLQIGSPIPTLPYAPTVH